MTNAQADPVATSGTAGATPETPPPGVVAKIPEETPEKSPPAPDSEDDRMTRKALFFVAVCNFYVSLHKNSHSIYDKTWSSTVLISSTKMFRRYIHLHFGLWIWWPCSAQMKLRKAAKARLMRWCKPHAQRVSMEAPEWVKEQWAKQNKNMVADLFSKVNFNQDICTAIGAHFVCSRSQHHAFQNTSKIKGGIQRPAHHHGQEEAVGGVECGGRLVLGVWDEKRPALEPVLVSELLFPKN